MQALGALEFERRGQVCIQASPNGLFDELDGSGTLGCQRTGETQALLEQRVVCNDPIDEPPLLRLMRAQHLA